MRRLACLLFLATLLTGCPSESPPVEPTEPTTQDTSEGTDAAPKDPPQDPPKGPEGLDGSNQAEEAMGLMAQGMDPVCGKEVSLNNATTHVWGDTTFVFCSAECLETFKKEPKKYSK